MKKKIISLLLSVLMLASLTACGGCDHEWNPATCTEASTCAKCGEISGEAAGHVWGEATCSAPETCYNCGETQGEALPHTYGAWEIGTNDMTHTCTVCGESETQALDYEVALKSLLEGNWSFYYQVTGGTAVDCYSGFPGAFVRFGDNGTCSMYVPNYQGNGILSDILTVELTVTDVEYYSDNAAYDFYLLADDGSAVIGQLFVGNDGSLALNILMDQNTSATLTKNYREEASFAGTWVATKDGELYTLELMPDGTLGGDYSGFWNSKAAINANGTWYSGFSIIYQDGDVYSFGDGQMYVCSDTMDVWETFSNGYNTTSITLYYGLGDTWLGFDKVNADQYDDFKAAHEAGAEKIVGTWDADKVSYYDANVGETVEETGSFSITFNADGTFTSQLVTPLDSTWSYRGAEMNGSDINLLYDIEMGEYDTYFRIMGDGSLFVSSLDGKDGYYYSYTFTTPEGRTKQAEAEQEAIDRIVGNWTCSDVNVYDSSNENAEGEQQPGSFSMTFNADGTVSASLLDEFEATWSYDGTSKYDGQTYYNYYVEKDGTREYVTLYESGSLSISTSPDNIVWYSYYMTKKA